MPASTVRAFIAVEFSAGLRQQLGGLSRQLQTAVPPRTVNWVKPDLIHITLKFLGDAPEGALPGIAARLDRVAAQTEPFTLTTDRLGCFPNLRQPRVIWVGVASESATHLTDLARAVEAAIAPLGFPAESRPFSPHITLGRVRRETAPRQAAAVGDAINIAGPVEPWSDRIESITLMKSDLQPGGPVYTIIHNTQYRKGN